MPHSSTSSSEYPTLLRAKAHVLVVDDEPLVRRVVVSSLESLGYSVEEAKDGVCALSRLKTTRFDLVVTDLQMPRLDGAGLADHMTRRRDKTPILFLTGAPGLMPKHPAYDLLQKPFRLNQLKEAVEAKLESTMESE